jgi:hypothetical protein
MSEKLPPTGPHVGDTLISFNFIPKRSAFNRICIADLTPVQILVGQKISGQCNETVK